MRWKLEKKKRRGLDAARRRVKDTLDEGRALSGAMSRLKRMRLGLLPRPVGPSGEDLNPVLPSDLTSLNDMKLGRLHGQFCLMAQYAQLYLALHAVEKSVAKQREKFVRARTHLMTEGTIPDRGASVETDHRVRQRAIETLTAEGVETMSEAVLQSFVIGKEACSREMTRRQSLAHDRT